MSRNYIQFGPTRILTSAADTVLPIAPENLDSSTAGITNAGWTECQGAMFLLVDVFPLAGATGTMTIQMLAWSRALQKWCATGTALSITAPAAPQVAVRTTVLNWCSGFVFPFVTALFTAGNPTSVSVGFAQGN